MFFANCWINAFVSARMITCGQGTPFSSTAGSYGSIAIIAGIIKARVFPDPF